ncbi:MAG: MBL fold metallo-hydrolase, partial [Clostridiales bacterium]|nr:MBL fold metallo-hydrolase [Clostridiales bacterium]
MKFEIQSMVLGVVGTNCYLLINKETKETVIFDPGDDGERIARYIEREGLKPQAILLTHGHFDHMMGVLALTGAYPVPVYIHEAEADVLESPELNA